MHSVTSGYLLHMGHEEIVVTNCQGSKSRALAYCFLKPQDTYRAHSLVSKLWRCDRVLRANSGIRVNHARASESRGLGHTAISHGRPDRYRGRVGKVVSVR